MSKRQVNLGLKHPSQFSLEERRMIIEEYLNSGKKKKEIWYKYTGQPEERGRLLRWMRQLGYDIAPKWGKLADANQRKMAKKSIDNSVENVQLKEKIKHPLWS